MGNVDVEARRYMEVCQTSSIIMVELYGARLREDNTSIMTAVRAFLRE
jgi:hypothetical protein